MKSLSDLIDPAQTNLKGGMHVNAGTGPGRQQKRKFALLTLTITAVSVSLAFLVFSITKPQVIRPPVVIRDVVYDYSLPNYCVGDIYEPSMAGTAVSPAVIVVHGGAWTAGSKNDIETKDIVQKLVESGFVVFNINYRLQSNGGSFPHNVEDVKKAVEYLSSKDVRYHVDSQQLAILGISAGAHLALLAAYTPDSGIRHLQAVVAIAPATDLSSIDNPLVTICFPKSDAHRRNLASPITYAASGISTLLVHGTADKVIPFEQSEKLAAALTRAKIPVQLLAVKGANHDFIVRQGQQQDEAIRDIVRFLKTQLSPK